MALPVITCTGCRLVFNPFQDRQSNSTTIGHYKCPRCGSDNSPEALAAAKVKADANQAAMDAAVVVEVPAPTPALTPTPVSTPASPSPRSGINDALAKIGADVQAAQVAEAGQQA